MMILTLPYQAVEGTLAVPDWEQFSSVVQSIYDDVKSTVKGGANATYIPVLAEQVRHLCYYRLSPW